MSGDDLACKRRELSCKNTIQIRTYELEDNIVTNLKQKKCIVVDTIRKLVNLTLLMGRIEQFV
jgi:hypothetical protein